MCVTRRDLRRLYVNFLDLAFSLLAQFICRWSLNDNRSIMGTALASNFTEEERLFSWCASLLRYNFGGENAMEGVLHVIYIAGSYSKRVSFGFHRDYFSPHFDGVNVALLTEC